jgi:dynein heavy chain, axonemal
MLSFSARTSANQIQDRIDGNMEKRQRATFGPVAGCTFVVFVDDMNMPEPEPYGAQPPLELLRQVCV